MCDSLTQNFACQRLLSPVRTAVRANSGNSVHSADLVAYSEHIYESRMGET